MIEHGDSKTHFLLKYSGCEIPFRVRQTERSKLTINVLPDMKVEVLGPSNKAIDLILARVDRRARWIVKQWRYFEQFQPTQPPRRFVSGETHLFLGRQYRLRVIRAIRAKVKLRGRFFYAHCPDPGDTARVSSLLGDWYLQHASGIFSSRVCQWITDCRSLALADVPSIVVRPMTRRWGSCTKKGTVTFNIDLVKVPMNCIDYVVVHELCHLKIHDHSPRFYRLLGKCMPDWEQRKKRLDAIGI